MKTSILKNLVILSLAFSALFVISNNVFADETTIGEIGTDSEVTCYGRGVYNANPVGYYYCDGVGECRFVKDANYDPWVGSKNCNL